MKRIELIVIVLLSFQTSSLARECHHYSRWHYPYPQSCGSSPIGRGNGLKIHTVRVQLPPAALIEPSWIIEADKLPTNLDDLVRQEAINKLKEKLNR